MADDFASDTNLNAQVDEVMSLIGDDEPAAEAPSGAARDERGRFASQATPDSEPASDAEPDTAPDADPASDDTTADPDPSEVEPDADPAIEPPASLSQELKARFRELPPDVQQAIAQFEEQRTTGVNLKLQEAANARKAAEAAQQAATAEQQRLAGAIQQALSVAQFDPVVAQWAQMTPEQKAQLRDSDLAGYLRLKEDAEGRIQRIHEMRGEQQRLQQTALAERTKQEHAALLTAMPELRDPQKAKQFAEESQRFLSEAGYQPHELASLGHRELAIVRDAMRFRAAEKARQTAAAKAAKPPAPRTQRPGTGTSAKGSTRETALRNFEKASSLHDQAEALAALLDD